MTSLRQALTDYLSMRRTLGFKLDRAERLLGQFVGYLEQQQATTITIEHALAWATLPEGAGWWHAMRMSTVRGFAIYLQTLDASVEVPPKGMIAYRLRRATPYLYSDADVRAVMAAAARHPYRLPAATYPALIGLLAVTGMRIGEAIALDTSDFDQRHGVLTVRSGKLGKARVLPLDPSTTTALTQYLQTRNALRPKGSCDTLFVSLAGTRLRYNRVSATYNRFARDAGLLDRSPSCTPRLHDLRHSFAVATILDAYRRGENAAPVLPKLSTYLGHTDPKHTYWYLSAAPELLGLAADRLENRSGAPA
jgi:integrase